MEINEIIEIMTSEDSSPESVKQASKALTKIRIHKIHNLRIIAKLLANGHVDIAQQFAADTNTDMTMSRAATRVVERYRSGPAGEPGPEETGGASTEVA